MPFIYSTATCNTDFAFYRSTKDLDKVERVITINGNANVINQKTFLTEQGAVTRVTEEELEELKKHNSFIDAVEAGFYKISKSNVDIDKAVKDMTAKDASAPITPTDPMFQGEDAVKPMAPQEKN